MLGLTLPKHVLRKGSVLTSEKTVSEYATDKKRRGGGSKSEEGLKTEKE